MRCWLFRVQVIVQEVQRFCRGSAEELRFFSRGGVE